MEKFRKCLLISIIILICVIIGEISAQNTRTNRKKSNGINLQKSDGFDYRINQNTNNGLSQHTAKQKRPGSGQRRRMKNNNHQRQDHGQLMPVLVIQFEPFEAVARSLLNMKSVFNFPLNYYPIKKSNKLCLMVP